jgi:hypothetical protein
MRQRLAAGDGKLCTFVLHDPVTLIATPFIKTSIRQESTVALFLCGSHNKLGVLAVWLQLNESSRSLGIDDALESIACNSVIIVL